MLEVGKEYSSAEFYRSAGITKRAWETRREDVLDHISTFYEFTITPSGRKIIYKIIRILKEPYEPLPKKRDSEKIREFYKQETHKIVEEDPWNTGANVARRIVAEDNKYSHAEATAANYVRPIIREDYYREDTQWMRCDYDLNCYVPLTKKQAEYLKECFNSRDLQEAYINSINTYAEMQSGYVTEEEAGNSLRQQVGKIFDTAMARFWAEYGFRPLRVSKLVEGQPLDFTA